MAIITITGTLEEVESTMKILEKTNVVCSVSGPTKCNDDERSLMYKMEAKEIVDHRLAEVVGLAMYIDSFPKFEDGMAGWYGWIRIGMTNVEPGGPFRTEHEAITYANAVAERFRKNGQFCYTYWDYRDRAGIPMN